MAVRHFDLTFTTVGPVHIGDGGEYGKKDYFADKGKVAVLDVPTFISKLDAEQMDRYLRFLGADSSVGLQELLSEQDDLRQAAISSALYWVETPLARAPRGSRNFYPVARFVKDAYGSPYVPGSSVKGMLRTAILSHLVMSNRKTYLAIFDGQAARDSGKNAAAPIQREAFWREAPDPCDLSVVNDVMRYVSVSDSEPLSVSDLVFAKKYDKFAKSDDGAHKRDMGRLSNRDYYEGNNLNIYRECLRPGVEVAIRVDIDDRVGRYLEGMRLDLDGLRKVFAEWFALYERCFEDHFDVGEDSANGGAVDDGRCRYVAQAGPLAGRRCSNAAVGDTGFCNTHKGKAAELAAGANAGSTLTCYLGGGVGFASKSVMNALFANEGERVDEIAHVLFSQFPSKFVSQRFRGLEERVEEAGFQPVGMRQRGKQAKNDHRHWMSSELGVAPHTLKMGIVGEKKYPMGKCSLRIEESR